MIKPISMVAIKTPLLMLSLSNFRNKKNKPKFPTKATLRIGDNTFPLAKMSK